MISYVGLVNNTLSSYAAIASNGSTPPKNLEILYIKDHEDTLAILNNETILDSGSLSVENPNNFVVTAQIRLRINMPETTKNLIEFKVNDKTIDKNNYIYENGGYTYVLENKNMEALESIDYNFIINGDALYTDLSNVEYYFEVTESIYS